MSIAASTVLPKWRTEPSDPAYRKPLMIGRTAGISDRGQFPEYEAWIARRSET